ncbi:MAG: hypothetical protein M3010_07210, partial [Candidatus Dormibacteraeota bacterium]|nr:hypothetical protein [Candidatus Dormibacteraeota bacterium]
MTTESGAGGESIADTWARFKAEHGRQLDAWLRAERALARARARGTDGFEAGEQLLVAEAELQTAIVEFAAAHDGGVNPSSLALEILRLAEGNLDAPRSRPAPRGPSKG